MALTISVPAFSGFDTFVPYVINQMTGYVAESPGLATTNATYVYNANGNRTGKYIRTTEYTENTEYIYDEDNRLISVTVRDTEIPKTYNFGYDYRTRRISRETPTEKTIHVFDGGLSVQEYDASTTNTSPSYATGCCRF